MPLLNIQSSGLMISAGVQLHHQVGQTNSQCYISNGSTTKWMLNFRSQWLTSHFYS